jgi:hypothetical protein
MSGGLKVLHSNVMLGLNMNMLDQGESDKATNLLH